MKVLFDENVPRRLRRELAEFDVRTVSDLGWTGKKNGDLLSLACPEFEVLLTMDTNLPFLVLSASAGPL